MYSTAYILLFFAYAAMAIVYRYVDEKAKTRLKIASVALFMLFFGFRGFVGDDWTNYYPCFDGMYDDSLVNMVAYIRETADFEPGFMALLLICKILVNDYHFFIFICCVINCALLYRFLSKRVDNLPLAFLVFLSMSGTGIEINLLRNSIALLICLNALEFIPKRKPLPYFGLCLLAMSMHLSSVIYIPLYFFLHRRMPRWVYISLFVGATLFLLAQINFIGPIMLAVASRMGEIYVELVNNYIEGELANVQGFISIGLLERLMTGILIICYYDKLVNISKDNAMFINAFLLYFLSFALFREFEVVSRRIAILFVFCYWILWCDFFKCFVYKGNRMLFAFFLFCYGVLKLHSMTNEPKSEYDNILFGAKSYEERYSIYMLTKDK